MNHFQGIKSGTGKENSSEYVPFFVQWTFIPQDIDNLVISPTYIFERYEYYSLDIFLVNTNINVTTSDTQKVSMFSLYVWRILEFVVTRSILSHSQKLLEMRSSDFTL